jgi:hypothetical protein
MAAPMNRLSMLTRRSFCQDVSFRSAILGSHEYRLSPCSMTQQALRTVVRLADVIATNTNPLALFSIKMVPHI